MELLDLVVISAATEAQDIRSVVLAAPDKRPLPGWDAGAHVELALPNGETRSYSLVNTDSHPQVTRIPRAYRLGVRLEAEGGGGSAYVHSLKVGERIRVSAPRNNFLVDASREEAVLVAGGIGITPIVSMAAELTAQARPYRLIYAGRSRDHLAFLDEIESLCGMSSLVHCDKDDGVYDLGKLMASLSSQSMYICGPLPLIDAAIAHAKELGWRDGRLHFEVFAAPAARDTDAGFQLVLKRSGQRVTVLAGQSILDALSDAGLAPVFDCRRGECGICRVPVLEGVPDHRDYCLSESEQAANDVIQICVSRSKTSTLVLDL